MAGYCAPAFAAAPVKGAVYHGFEGGPGGPVGVREHATTLRVALDGTGLSARRGGSWVDLRLRCGSERFIVVRARLSGPRSVVRVGRTGGFRHSGIVKGVRFRIIGRFATRDTVHFTYRASRSTARIAKPYSRRRCSSGLRRVVAYRNGLQPLEGCKPRGTRILARSNESVAFVRYRLPGSERYFVPDPYACLLSGEPLLLARFFERVVFNVALAGPYVAYSVSDCVLSCFDDVVLRDLRDGSRLPVGPVVVVPHRDGSLVDGESVVDLVVRQSGTVAWIVAECCPDRRWRYQVVAEDSTGRRMLSDDPLIRPRSLTLTGSTLNWTEGQTPRSAPLN